MNVDVFSWFDDIQAAMEQEGSLLKPWAEILPQQLHALFNEKVHGDQQRWLDALESLPAVEDTITDLQQDCIQLASDALTDDISRQIKTGLEQLSPWRKGPFQFFDTHIDTEWRSDWKWQRIAAHLAPLEGRTILDVGCGSGYHMWRMLGAGAYRVVGIDPSRLFLAQFQAFKQYAQLGQQQSGSKQPLKIDLLPLKMEDVPRPLKAFDTTFSMGVLYHRKSPIDHLAELKDTLKPGGQLVLETLVIEGELGEVLMPEDRYAQMRNVWFLPSCDTLLLWARRAGFKNPRIVEKNVTRLEEQRSTDWMQYQSLTDFLDADDKSKTAEGYPAPLRATLIAEA
ncbi:Methyltransferase [Oleispira antarctica RB-8]|uniref:tRNA U34 carboxymethyltransferase n=1 Tax=Oleispira antarctica RB-8 TaxID=698738 RepID=R4YK10_OLEAN|nr:Methyltransferase [Oleispira antarctica RB-8]|tara:strand:- start:2468 stop:3487 length:1020 start_codon:yes stop_codon:yes gene_type:complete